jgi:hypothetical protein
VQLASDVTESKYAWDTRNVEDGVYELRVVVSDAASNPDALAREAARISEIITVDNTGPRVRDLAAAEAGDGAFTVTGELVDATSRIVSVHYAVDSQDQWQALLPADGVADGRREKIKFTTDALSSGAHRITVKVTDVYGNAGYASVIVKVD